MPAPLPDGPIPAAVLRLSAAQRLAYGRIEEAGPHGRPMRRIGCGWGTLHALVALGLVVDLDDGKPGDRDVHRFAAAAAVAPRPTAADAADAAADAAADGFALQPPPPGRPGRHHQSRMW